MTGRRLRDLPAASALTGVEKFYADIGNADYRVTADQIKTFTNANLPTVDPLDYGAAGDGVTDDSAAIQAAIDALQADLGGTVWFGSRQHWAVYSTLTINAGSPIQFLGHTDFTNYISAGQVNSEATDCGVLNILGSHCLIRNLTFFGPEIPGTTNSTVTVGAGSVETKIDNCFIWFGQYPIKMLGFDNTVSNTNAGYSYGAPGAIVYSAGGNWYIRNKFDHSFPVQAGYSQGAWQATTAYVVGDMVEVDGFRIQCAVSGTSGGSEPTLRRYGLAFTDGSVSWYLVAPHVYYSMQFDTGSSENTVYTTDHSGAFSSCIAMTNTLSGTAPRYTRILHGTLGQQYGNAVYLAAGSNFTIESSNIGTGSGAAGVYVGSGFTRDAVIANNNIDCDGAPGVEIAGSERISVQGNIIATAGSGHTHGVRVTGAAAQFTISNNIIDGFSSVAVDVGANASDFYLIADNVAHSVATIADAGTGTTKLITAPGFTGTTAYHATALGGVGEAFTGYEIYGQMVGAQGPFLYLSNYKTTTAAPGDVQFTLRFGGYNSTGSFVDPYAQIYSVADDVTGGSEDSSLHFKVRAAGAEVDSLVVAGTLASLAVPMGLKSYAKSGLPGHVAGAMIYISDATGGAQPFFSDGSDWRRVTDRTTVT